MAILMTRGGLAATVLALSACVFDPSLPEDPLASGAAPASTATNSVARDGFLPPDLIAPDAAVADAAAPDLSSPCGECPPEHTCRGNRCKPDKGDD